MIETMFIWIILAPFVVSAISVAVTFLLAWLLFPGGRSRGPLDTVASRVIGGIFLVVMEWLAEAFLIMALPFRFLRSNPRARAIRSSIVPIVVLPGCFENVATLFVFQRRLERSLRIPVKVLTPRAYLTGVEILALDYQRQIETWCQQMGAKQVDLIGHGLGGLVARYLTEGTQSKGWARAVITIATPHLGSAWATILAFGRNIRQMRRGSAFLEKLNRSNESRELSVVGISTTHDNIVVPWNCALSPQGDNYILRFRGHFTLIFSTEVIRLITKQLAVISQ